jgi:hypothetical protein
MHGPYGMTRPGVTKERSENERLKIAKSEGAKKRVQRELELKKDENENENEEGAKRTKLMLLLWLLKDENKT